MKNGSVDIQNDSPKGKKNQNLENNPEKNCVRMDIITQFDKWLDFAMDDNSLNDRPLPVCISAVTLPGMEWYFERALASHLKTKFTDEERPVIKFTGAEYDKTEPSKRFVSYKNMPINSRLANAPLSEVVNGNIYWGNNDAGYFVKEEYRSRYPSTRELVNFYWADYCGRPSRALLDDFADVVSRIDNGLAYITFYTTCRKKGGNSREIIVELFGDNRGKGSLPSNIHDAIISAMNRALLKRGVASRTRLIYDVRYGGGSMRNQAMMTIGVAVGLPKKLIHLVQENRMGDELRILRSMSATRLEKSRWSRRWAGVKDNKSGNMCDTSFCRKVYRRWAKGIDNVKIAAELGVEPRKVGSTLAWLSPNLFKNSSGIKRKMMEQAKALRIKNGFEV